ncbi:hypothetical protein E1301_Tti013707 [Triplophysa tibetana]|uniref:Myb/SANT-like DNA-binding domain-containing protein n=1 Tax=Triplophysa tibetana TaxID=1572043 RepID=A0A5A9NI91_9TELE|nr:hypothetical protein E1301_Tti013707 [Triplophysa tibetana]
MSSRKSRHFWGEEETDVLLQTLKEMNIDRYKDGRKRRNSLIFRKVCAKHKAMGFLRSCDQVKHRWKTLKSIYYKAKRQNISSSDGAFKHFDTMEEIFGHRPPVTSNQTVTLDDVHRKDESPVAENECSTFDEDECDENGLDDEESGIEEIQPIKTENEPLILTQPLHESSAPAESATSTQPSISLEIINCTPASTSQQPSVQDMFKEKGPCCTALHTQYQHFFERMQQTQNMWLESHLEQGHAREERLVARVLTEHTRSMETLINQLFAGLRSLLPHHQLQSNPQPIHTDILNPHPDHIINPTEHLQTSSVPSQPEDHTFCSGQEKTVNQKT